MKKLFLATVCLLCSFAVSAETPATSKPNKKPIAVMYIMTDCGTVHQIPLDTPDDDVCLLIDLYTKVDC